MRLEDAAGRELLRLPELRLDQRLFVTAMAFRVTAMHHVQLAMPPAEEDAGRAFYGGLLGLSEVPKPQTLAGRGGVWFRGSSVEVHLGVERDGFTPARKAHPAFVVEGLDELRSRLHGAGYRTDDDPPLEGYRRFHVRDPFGNRLELLEPA